MGLVRAGVPEMSPAILKVKTMSDLRELAMKSKAWPFQEARKLVKRYEKAPPEKGYVLFETGYGPSGLPHIGKKEYCNLLFDILVILNL